MENDMRNEVEITPRMVEAGENCLARLYGEISSASLVRRVFEEMAAADRLPAKARVERAG